MARALKDLVGEVEKLFGEMVELLDLLEVEPPAQSADRTVDRDIIASLTEQERALMDRYTTAEPCVEEGYPDPHWPVLRIGVQSFRVGPVCDTKELADWMRAMLGKALARVVEEQSATTSSAEPPA